MNENYSRLVGLLSICKFILVENIQANFNAACKPGGFLEGFAQPTILDKVNKIDEIIKNLQEEKILPDDFQRIEQVMVSIGAEGETITIDCVALKLQDKLGLYVDLQKKVDCEKDQEAVGKFLEDETQRLSNLSKYEGLLNELREILNFVHGENAATEKSASLDEAAARPVTVLELLKVRCFRVSIAIKETIQAIKNEPLILFKLAMADLLKMYQKNTHRLFMQALIDEIAEAKNKESIITLVLSAKTYLEKCRNSKAQNPRSALFILTACTTKLFPAKIEPKKEEESEVTQKVRDYQEKYGISRKKVSYG